MLGNFPVELVEEILLYLGIVDLIVILKTNKRLYSITHNEKSPLRHKLVQRDFNLDLYFTKGFNEEYGDDECSCRTVEEMKLSINRTIRGEEISAYACYEIALIFWRNKVCSLCRKTGYYAEIDKSDLKYPLGIITKTDSPEMSGSRYIIVKHDSLEEGINNFANFMSHLTNNHFIYEYRIEIYGDVKNWETLVPFLDADLPTIKKRPLLRLEYLNINTDEFFQQKFFDRGLSTIELALVNEREYGDLLIFYHDILKKTENVFISCTRVPTYNENYLTFMFENTRSLTIHGPIALSNHAISNLMKNCYEHPHPKGRKITFFEFSDIFLVNYFIDIPKKDYYIKEDESEAHMIDKFGNEWIITDERSSDYPDSCLKIEQIVREE